MNDKLILLVEDNYDDEIITLQALKEGKMFVNTMVVRDGQEALDYIFKQGLFEKSKHENPLVILLDLKLPKIDGIDVLKKISENELTKNIPVIILTSSIHETDQFLSYNFGAKNYIVKPLDLTKLNNIIHLFLNHCLEQNTSIS